MRNKLQKMKAYYINNDDGNNNNNNSKQKKRENLKIKIKFMI